MQDLNYIAQYGYDNAEPTFTPEVYEDACGGLHAGIRPKETAYATNAIVLIVDDFIERRGIFDSTLGRDFLGGDFDKKDLLEAISQIMVDLNKTE